MKEGPEASTVDSSTRSETMPDNFALAGSVHENKDAALRDFPELGNAVQLTVDVNRGDMLYLPASYFHEVVSYSDNADSGTLPCHLAINYWFHPPDVLDPNNWANPYSSNYWRRQWAKLQLERLDRKRKRADEK